MSFPPISELIPHRGQAIWLEHIVSWVGTECVAVGRLPSSGGKSAGVACEGIELLAQGAAAYACLRDGDQKQGYVASVQRASFGSSHLPVDIPLEVKVTETGVLGRARSFVGEIKHAGEILVSGEMVVIETPKGALLP